MNILLKTWLALEIFAVIFVLTMSRSLKIAIACSDKSSKFNSFACTLVVLDFFVFGGTNFSLMNEGNIFLEFLFLLF